MPSSASKRELDGDALGDVLAVAVLDGVDDRLAHGHADPMDGVLVEAGDRAQPIAHELNEVQQLERAGELRRTTCGASLVMRTQRTHSIHAVPRDQCHSARMLQARRSARNRAAGAARARPAAPPGDKSISHRYALLAALADGTLEVRASRPRRRLRGHARLPAGARRRHRTVRAVTLVDIRAAAWAA